MTAYIFSDEDLKVLEKINRGAAEQASKDLSKLINKPISLKSFVVRELAAEKLTGELGKAEDTVTTIAMKIKGDILGYIMMIYPQESATRVANIMASKGIPSTEVLSEDGKWAPPETGSLS